MPVHVGDVYTVQGARADKAQALKILEEAAEVFSAWEAWEDLVKVNEICGDHEQSESLAVGQLASECADLITATCGMLAALGVGAECELWFCRVRNEQRGRVME